MENKDTLKINRLVLVGNGFDLAIGLKTSYSDFILWLKKKLIIEAFNNPSRDNNSLATLPGYLENDLYKIKIRSLPKSSWEDFLKSQEEKSHKEQNDDFQRFLTLHKKILIISPRETFVSIIDKNIEVLGWVNIENIYYQCLKKAKGEDLKFVNNQLSLLKTFLKEYLSEEQEKLERSSNYLSPFRSPIVDKDIDFEEFNPDSQFAEGHLKLNRIQFVNFNYTNTVQKLVESFSVKEKDQTNKIIPIHGGLDDSMIFGYGDEEDDGFSTLEKNGNNDYLEHVKSFRYLQDSNYYDLIRFINSCPYQIIIYGHSCGLSDRTMLKELFENKNCLSIKPYYYERSEEKGENDYFDKVMEISRHFTNNGLMRKKVVNILKCKPMPKPRR